MHAVSLFASSNLVKATSALRAVLETYPNCGEARELLEVTYKSQSGARLPVDLSLSLKRGTEAFVGGRQRDAIESWKQCLMEEPGQPTLAVAGAHGDDLVPDLTAGLRQRSARSRELADGKRAPGKKRKGCS